MATGRTYLVKSAAVVGDPRGGEDGTQQGKRCSSDLREGRLRSPVSLSCGGAARRAVPETCESVVARDYFVHNVAGLGSVRTKMAALPYRRNGDGGERATAGEAAAAAASAAGVASVASSSSRPASKFQKPAWV
ncbi:hypothetical protein OsJ_20506 [Oryza sativa Japonica Group]|uniref:Uncharacterized protein n=1 Tax=Oryza sativa subsp. japonica TaxID=39947 RepID=Q69SP0_ORYSJ|nr:hypothetical protein OsJ_20506 [Oryza sativa Japonica Group]BAD35995.1 hypothetical protein [Oryza sativa Japonica Group]BAD36187.1 hypothetical protein [Oryza sativa Japonica Group]